MNALKIILLAIQLGFIGFFLLYALPRVIRSYREFRKKSAEIMTKIKEMEEETSTIFRIINGTATKEEEAIWKTKIEQRYNIKI